MEVRVHGLSHTFVNGKPARRALADLEFTISSRQFTAVIGSSGCGKSTLLRLAGDLLHPSRGKILLDGRQPLAMRQAHRIAWMAQSPALLPWLTARQNVALAQQFTSHNQDARVSPETALNRVGLNDAVDAYPFTLSGGMQQRLALARLLSQNADLWLMDEPFAALDEITRERLTTELLEIWQPLQPTVLWVTHNIYEAVRLADRILVMTPSPGQIAADIPIPLPRPRQEADLSFQRIVAAVRAVMSFQPQPRESA